MRARVLSLVSFSLLVGCGHVDDAHNASPTTDGGGSAGASGAGGGGTSVSVHPLCTGGDGVRLAFFTSGGGQDVVDRAQRAEPGYDFLYVDASCHYWVRSGDEGDTTWLPTREGTLDAAQERQLADAIHYESFAELAGVWAGESAFDQGSTVVHDGAHRIWLNGFGPRRQDGKSDAQAARLNAIEPALRAWEASLRASGADMAGPMRVSVWSGCLSPSASEHAFPWPLSQPPAAIARPCEIGYQRGTSLLVTKPEELAALRKVRAGYLQLPPGYAVGGLATQAAGDEMVFQLSLRDALPFEDASGVIPAPP